MTNNTTQSWSIIILCYNEEISIKRVVEKALDILKIISKNEGQLVVVNDGSTDNSHLIIEQLQKAHNNITYINHLMNKGIGKSLHSGYSNAVEENVIMIPGDDQFNIKELIPYKNFISNSFLSFYRVDNHIYSKSRKLLSACNQILNRAIIGIKLKDVNWVKAYKNESLKNLDLQVTSSLIESEICSKLFFTGHKVIEIESTYYDNSSSESLGASFKIIKQALKDIPKLIWVCLNFKANHQR